MKNPNHSIWLSWGSGDQELTLEGSILQPLTELKSSLTLAGSIFEQQALSVMNAGVHCRRSWLNLKVSLLQLQSDGLWPLHKVSGQPRLTLSYLWGWGNRAGCEKNKMSFQINFFRIDLHSVILKTMKSEGQWMVCLTENSLGLVLFVTIDLGQVSLCLY